MVVMKEGVKESSLKRRRQHDFPTPESPISKSLIYLHAVSKSAKDELHSHVNGSAQGKVRADIKERLTRKS